MSFYTTYEIKVHKAVPAFRKDPVPGTGKHYYHASFTYRRVKCWFGSHRMDRIREYRPYVRCKGRVPWLIFDEQWELGSKSWKENTKCRHQWEVHAR